MHNYISYTVLKKNPKNGDYGLAAPTYEYREFNDAWIAYCTAIIKGKNVTKFASGSSKNEAKKNVDIKMSETIKKKAPAKK